MVLRLSLSVCLLVTALARDAAADATAIEVVGEGRAVSGVGSVSELWLGLAGAGAELRLAPTVAVRATVLGLGSIGSVEGGDPARAGAGGELSVRLVPWPEPVLRPYLRGGLGVMLFAEPFLPGGTHYDAMLSFGGGAELRVSDRWTFAVDVATVHLSNGQGLGPHNPAYDGYAVSASIARALTPRPTTVEARPAIVAGDGAGPGVIGEASVGAVDGELLVSGRARVAQRIARALLVQLEGEGGSLAGAPFAELGVDLPAHLGGASLAPHLGYRRFVGVDTLVVGLQAERHLRDVSAVVMAHHERGELGTLWRAAAGLRAFPRPSLMVELGLGFDRLGEHSLGDSADPYFGFEWQVPVGSAWQASLVVERQVSGIHLAGLRVRWGMGPSLARGHGWQRVR